MNDSQKSPALVGALLIGISCFFLLAGYEFVRTPTNTLYKATYGKENLATIMAMIPVAVAIFVYLYTRILSYFGPRKTMMITTIGSCSLIALGQFLFENGLKEAIIFLYLFRSAYVVLLIQQCWSFLNSTLSEAEGKKFFGPICGIASIGAVLAGIFGSQLVSGLGTSNMLLLAALVTIPAALFADMAFAKCGEPQPSAEEKESGKKDHLALGLFKSEKILVVVLSLIIMTQIVSAVLGLTFQGELQDAIPDADAQSAYSFSFYSWINGLAAVLQFAVAPLLMTFVPLGLIHIGIPIIHIATCIVCVVNPGLTSAAVAYMTFKVVDYSIFIAAKEVLYMPLPFDARYRAKEVIDVFGYRFSKGATAGVMSLVQKSGIAITETSYALAGVVAASFWFILVMPLSKRFKQDNVK
jgi:ATP:ADP antiporter, AAA family